MMPMMSHIRWPVMKLPGSFMTGQRMWLIIGVIVAIVGLALAYNGIRRPARP